MLNFLLSLLFTIFIFYILKSEPSILYMALIWMIPVAIYFWHKTFIADNNIFLKIEKKLLPSQSSTKRK